MKRRLVFATNNTGKAQEISGLLSEEFDILTLEEIGCHEDIPETDDTLEGNALIKAKHVFDNYGYDCFADDTGLEVSALGGAPGVYSARYAGENCTPDDNIDKLIRELGESVDRTAQFRTSICLMRTGKEPEYFDGVVKGEILRTREGKGGFGYDPVFKPNASDISFAEMSKEEKNAISHRGNAVRKLVEFLKSESQ